MHIIRICPAYFPHYHLGGSVVADYEIDKGLVAEGHSVTVLTCKNKRDELSEECLSPRHRVIRFESLGNIKYGISLGAIIGILKQIFKNKDDGVFWFGGIWNLLTVLGPFLCRWFKKNYIITPHGMLVPSLIKMKSTVAKNLLVRTVIKSHLEKAYKVHFTVDEERVDTIVASGAEMEPLVFPLCLDLSKFDREPSNSAVHIHDKVTISFIGRITHKKRIDLIIDALSMLSPDVKRKVRFNVFGTDEERLWNYSLFVENKVGVEINYMGPVYGNELATAYHETDIFVLCSESENFAISAVEAAFCHCVPLLTKEVGVSKYFSDESAVFSNLNAFDISENIQALVSDPKKRKMLGKNARAVSEQFSAGSLDRDYFTKLIG